MNNISEQISDIISKMHRDEVLTDKETLVLAKWESRSMEHEELLAGIMHTQENNNWRPEIDKNHQPAWKRVEMAIATGMHEPSRSIVNLLGVRKTEMVATLISVFCLAVLLWKISSMHINSQKEIIKPVDYDITPTANCCLLMPLEVYMTSHKEKKYKPVTEKVR